MASGPLPRTLQPPPDLPSDPSISDKLAGYLRNFSLWCRHGFADKLSGSTALSGILLQASDAATGALTPFVYLVEIKVTVTGGAASAATIVLTPVPLGKAP